LIFVDTGPLLARYLPLDQHHDAAVGGWSEIERSSQRWLTSNFVVAETMTLLSRRASASFAAERGRRLYGSTSFEIVRPQREDEIAALEAFTKLADQRVSFTDCLSFALMKRNRLRRAFTFDRHFAAAGFEVWPAR
jgi:predicted nucleic acid-binding protein